MEEETDPKAPSARAGVNTNESGSVPGDRVSGSWGGIKEGEKVSERFVSDLGIASDKSSDRLGTTESVVKKWDD